VGFLVVTMASFSHTNYNAAITVINQMVQDGVTLCCEVLPCIGGESEEALRDDPEVWKEVVHERQEFQRLITLYFRLCCYEVRADYQARNNRYTWLDPNGGVCTTEERAKFLVATRRAAHWGEWDYTHHQRDRGTCWGIRAPFGLPQTQGTFPVPVRPAMVQTWLGIKLRTYFHNKWISPPVHARLMAQLKEYTAAISELIKTDRTPLPFTYVQMAATITILFVMTLPFALVKEFGWATPFITAFIAYAYGGLYLNSISLHNPYNYEGTRTGVPINVFVQRLQRVTETVLHDCIGDYEAIESSVPATELYKPHNDEDSAPVTAPEALSKKAWEGILQEIPKEAANVHRTRSHSEAVTLHRSPHSHAPHELFSGRRHMSCVIPRDEAGLSHLKSRLAPLDEVVVDIHPESENVVQARSSIGV